MFQFRTICGATVLLYCTFWGPLALAQSTDLPLQHWAYDFIERMEARGLVRGVLNGVKPFSRDEVVRYLVQVQDRVRQGARLNPVETRQLAFLRFEFKEEFIKATGSNGIHYRTQIEQLKQHPVFGKAFPGFLYKNNRNLFSIKSADFQAFVDPVFSQQLLYAGTDSVRGTERVFERSHGFRVRGNLGEHIGFFFDFRDTKEWGTRSYPDRFDISLPGLGFVNGYGTHIWHDETNAYLVFKLPYLQVQLGKNQNYWGPGANGALALSDNATSFDQIKLQSRFWRLKFTWLWGFLRTFPRIAQQDGRTAPKSLVAHRIEIDVARWLNVGLHETVIFGNRRLEIAYLNPINFYRSAEHFLSDDDNATLGFDFEFMAIPNTKLYGELFIDDLSTTKLGSNFFGNKTGLLAGGLWVDALRVPNLDLRLEYARTRPFLYSHRRQINQFTHFNTGLGHRIGPNSDELFAEAVYRFSKSLVVAANFTKFRHGDNEPNNNAGGEISQPFGEGASVSSRFLGGALEKRSRLGLETSYEVFRNFYLGLSGSVAFSKNIELSDGSRAGIDRNEVSLNFGINR